MRSRGSAIAINAASLCRFSILRPIGAALRTMPIVPLHTAGPESSIIYAMTSQRLLPQLMDMQFEVELLGSPDDPLRTELYILRDDLASSSGFLSAKGESSKFFTRRDNAHLILRSTEEGIVIALPPDRSLEEFHFDDARHGHTLKLMPDPSLLDPFRGARPVRALPWLRSQSPGFLAPDLSEDEVAEFNKISGSVMLDRGSDTADDGLHPRRMAIPLRVGTFSTLVICGPYHSVGGVSICWPRPTDRSTASVHACRPPTL